MPLWVQIQISLVFCILIIVLGYVFLISKLYKKSAQGKAYIRTGKGGVAVSFDGIMNIPFLYRIEELDLTMKSIDILDIKTKTLSGNEISLSVHFQCNIPKVEKEILIAAQTYGCDTINDTHKLKTHFEPQFKQAIKDVLSKMDSKEIENDSYAISKQIKMNLGPDLNGLTISECSVTNIEILNQ